MPIFRKAWHVLEPAAQYIYNWHREAISQHLEAIHRGEITGLQINQPPGTANRYCPMPGKQEGKPITQGLQTGKAREDYPFARVPTLPMGAR